MTVPLGRRTAVVLALVSAVGLLAFTWPLLVTPGAHLAGTDSAPVLLAGVLAAALAVTAVAFGDGGLDVKTVALLGLLTAVGALLRPLSAGTAGVELVFLVVVIGGRALGPGFGFVLGTTTLLTSALLTGGVGPWLPYQMLGAAWMGLGAGLLPRRLRGRAEVAVLAGYGALAGLAFGLLMNLSFWPFQLGVATGLSFVPGEPLPANLHRFLVFSAATSLAWDVGRAVTTAVGVLLLAGPGLRALRRTAARASFGPDTPDPPDTPTGAGLPGAADVALACTDGSRDGSEHERMG